MLDDGDHMVASNDREVVAQAVDHLVELGHRRIALIEGPEGFRSAHERREGFLGAMHAHGLDVPAAARAQGTYRFESGIAAASQLLDATERPTAIFASNDEMASGAFHAARQRNLRVPDDLSIIGFDDSPIAAHIWPPMTTVGWPVREMGRAAALKLIAPGDETASEHRFPATLVKRQSVAPPRV
jgi:LacI family transcriptional regulator